MQSVIEIVRVTRIDEPLLAAFAELIPQLSRTAAPPNASDLAAIVDAAGTTLYIARDGERIVGTLTLTIYRIPTGVQARIDDVVVDTAVRGRGVGEKLTAEAIHASRVGGARSISLTSRPDREAANRLYRRLGFESVETNVYRMRL